MKIKAKVDVVGEMITEWQLVPDTTTLTTPETSSGLYLLAAIADIPAAFFDSYNEYTITGGAIVAIGGTAPGNKRKITLDTTILPVMVRNSKSNFFNRF